MFMLEIDESTESEFGVNYVAMVDKPAIQEDFFAFADQHRLQFSEDDERIIIGPAIIPDQPIYRSDPEMGEFYVQFDKQTIEKAAIKFFENGFQSNINLMHSPVLKLSGITIFQSFIQDSKKNIAGMGNKYPDGTWFLGAKVKNDSAWSLIKQGKVKGWSVEGMFKYKPKPATDEQIFARLKDLLKDY